MVNVQELAVVGIEMGNYPNVLGWRGRKPFNGIPSITEELATTSNSLPYRLNFAQDKKHDDPAGHPYNHYTDEQIEEDKRAHENLDWLQKQVDERVKRGKRDEDDDKE